MAALHSFETPGGTIEFFENSVRINGHFVFPGQCNKKQLQDEILEALESYRKKYNAEVFKDLVGD